jgi:hypothetical protein
MKGCGGPPGPRPCANVMVLNAKANTMAKTLRKCIRDSFLPPKIYHVRAVSVHVQAPGGLEHFLICAEPSGLNTGSGTAHVGAGGAPRRALRPLAIFVDIISAVRFERCLLVKFRCRDRGRARIRGPDISNGRFFAHVTIAKADSGRLIGVSHAFGRLCAACRDIDLCSELFVDPHRGLARTDAQEQGCITNSRIEDDFHARSQTQPRQFAQ